MSLTRLILLGMALVVVYLGYPDSVKPPGKLTA